MSCEQRRVQTISVVRLGLIMWPLSIVVPLRLKPVVLRLSLFFLGEMGLWTLSRSVILEKINTEEDRQLIEGQ